MDAHICGRCGHLWAMHTGYSDYNRCHSPGCICERSQCNAEKHNNEDAREAIRVLAALCREWSKADDSVDERPWSWATMKAIERAEDAVDNNPIARAALEEQE